MHGGKSRGAKNREERRGGTASVAVAERRRRHARIAECMQLMKGAAGAGGGVNFGEALSRETKRAAAYRIVRATANRNYCLHGGKSMGKKRSRAGAVGAVPAA
jgi:hypothetical protein